jgi:hypothetical protein
MSHWASTWAYEQDIQPCGRKFVLVALAGFADEDGFCYPSQETLAKMTGQDVRSVKRHLKALEADEVIKRQPRWKRAGGRNSDGYTLQAPPSRLKPKVTECHVSKVTKCHGDKLSPELSENRKDPSVKKDPPLPPKGNGYRQPVKPPEEKYELPPDPFPMTNDLNVWLAEMCFSFSEDELANATQAWRESREGKPDRRPRTMSMWQADWKKFIRIYWEIRQRKGHKQGGDESDYHSSLVAAEKPIGYFDDMYRDFQR